MNFSAPAPMPLLDPHGHVGCLSPPVFPLPGDTKLRHVRKQAQLHPHEGSLLHRGGPIQVRWGDSVPPEPGCRRAAAAPCSALLLSSAGFAPCTACCTPTRRGAPPTWFTRRRVSPLTSSRISPVSDGRAGPACGCVNPASPRGGWTDGRTDVVAVVLHSVCTEGCCAAPCPLPRLPCLPGCPCPLPAPSGTAGRDGS